MGCPYHVMRERLAILEDKFGKVKGPEDESPLFPDTDGQFVTPCAMLELIELLAALTGEDPKDAKGRNRFGRHTWRASGAVFLTSLGLEVIKIQMLARLASSLITHYARLAPLKNLGEEFKNAMKKKRSGSEQLVTTTKPNINKAEVKMIMDEQLENMKQELNMIQDITKKVEKECRPKEYLKNRVTGSHHRILCSISDAGQGALTWCGWSYATKKFEVLSSRSPTYRGEVCGGCMPDLKASLPDKDA